MCTLSVVDFPSNICKEPLPIPTLPPYGILPATIDPRVVVRALLVTLNEDLALATWHMVVNALATDWRKPADLR